MHQPHWILGKRTGQAIKHSFTFTIFDKPFDKFPLWTLLMRLAPVYTMHQKKRPDDNGFIHWREGECIQAFGQPSIAFNLGLRRKFQWIFLAADLSTPTIRLDLLTEYSPFGDCSTGSLVSQKMYLNARNHPSYTWANLDAFLTYLLPGAPQEIPKISTSIGEY